MKYRLTIKSDGGSLDQTVDNMTAVKNLLMAICQNGMESVTSVTITIVQVKA